MYFFCNYIYANENQGVPCGQEELQQCSRQIKAVQATSEFNFVYDKEQLDRICPWVPLTKLTPTNKKEKRDWNAINLLFTFSFFSSAKGIWKYSHRKFHKIFSFHLFCVLLQEKLGEKLFKFNFFFLLMFFSPPPSPSTLLCECWGDFFFAFFFTRKETRGKLYFLFPRIQQFFNFNFFLSSCFCYGEIER